MPVDASSDPYDGSLGPDRDVDPKNIGNPAEAAHSAAHGAVHPAGDDESAAAGTKAAGLGAIAHDAGPEGKFGAEVASRGGVDLSGTVKASHLADLDHAGSGAKFDPAVLHGEPAGVNAHGVDLDAAGTGAAAKSIAALHDLGGAEHADKHFTGGELHGHELHGHDDLDGLNALKASVGVDAIGHDELHGAHAHGVDHDHLHDAHDHLHDDKAIHGHDAHHDVAHHDHHDHI